MESYKNYDKFHGTQYAIDEESISGFEDSFGEPVTLPNTIYLALAPILLGLAFGTLGIGFPLYIIMAVTCWITIWYNLNWGIAPVSVLEWMPLDGVPEKIETK